MSAGLRQWVTEEETDRTEGRLGEGAGCGSLEERVGHRAWYHTEPGKTRWSWTVQALVCHVAESGFKSHRQPGTKRISSDLLFQEV